MRRSSVSVVTKCCADTNRMIAFQFMPKYGKGGWFVPHPLPPSLCPRLITDRGSAGLYWTPSSCCRLSSVYCKWKSCFLILMLFPRIRSNTNKKEQCIATSDNEI